MANDAFALSPISARAALPSEEDYDAISEAFMETARGRWFLGEYARRNRNADTSMVLDAVARIEQSLAAQKQESADDSLADALTAIKAALDDARAAGLAALDNLALEESLTPVRKGARVIKEISWRWREIGADGRICDLLDSQVAAIEASCGQLSPVEPRAALAAAFDLIDSRLAEFDEREDVPAEAASIREAAADEASPPSSTPSPIAADEMPDAAAAEVAAEVAEVATVAAQTINATANAVAGTATEVADMAAEAADAHDEAVLDMIAMEMAEPDPFDMDAEAHPLEMHPEGPPLPEREAIAATPEAAAAPAMAPAMPLSPAPPPLQPALEPDAERSAKPSHESSPQPSDEPSLGSTLVASGILRKPISASDPLAPIRRMSQAERIALFS